MSFITRRSSLKRPLSTIRPKSTTRSPEMQCPSAPRLPPVSLPVASDDESAGASTGGMHGYLPILEGHPLVHEGQTTSIHANLVRTDQARPVVQPELTDMRPYNGHRWGAVDDFPQYAGNAKAIHFVESTESATIPPSRCLTVVTDRGEALPIYPRSGSEFVTVGDVQRMVIEWMRVVERGARLQGQTFGLSEKRLVYRGALVAEIEVWLWRGLKYEEIGTWSIQFQEALGSGGWPEQRLRWS